MRVLRLWAVMLLLAALLTPLIAAPALPARAQYPDWTAAYRPAMLPQYADDMLAWTDAPRYALALTLEPGQDEARITGTAAVEYTNRHSAPLDSIVFRLYPNLPSYGAVMTVSDVMADGVTVDPALDSTRSVLTVPLPAPLTPGARVEVSMAFEIILTAGRERLYAQFSYIDGVLSLPNAYPVLSVYEPGLGWWQVTDHPQGDAVYSETAFYTVQVTAPADLILVASGSEIDLAANADGTLTHVYVAPLMRDFALFASAAFVTLSGSQDGTAIHLTYDPALPGAQTAAQAGLVITQEAVRIFNRAFGVYPYSELDVVQTPNLASGIEYPGVFVIARSVWNVEDSFFEFVLVHEAAHEWWYALVGNDQTRHPWIDEALAQYGVALYIREREGDDAYYAALDSFRAQFEQYITRYPDRDQPIGNPVSAYEASAYFFMVYQKGPLLYAALDEMFGTEALLLALADLFAAYRYRIVEPQDMLARFEASLGSELDSLFAEWVGAFAVG